MPSPEATVPPLAETQRAFAAAILGGPDAAQPLLATLRGDADVNLRRLAAYHRNVIGNWIAALAATYPRTRAAMGDSCFERLARDFVRTHDSSSGDLNEYGEAFGDWLHTVDASGSQPWLADLARLEWDVQAAWMAGDCEPFDFAALAAIPAEHHGDLRFRLAPAFRRRRSSWPLADIWHGTHAARMTAEQHAIWVVRPLDRVGVESAGHSEDAFIMALGEGATLAAAIAGALAIDPAFAVGTALTRAAGLGLLAAVIAPGESS